MSGSSVTTWVQDKLYDLLDISDKNIAEFIIGLAKRCKDPEGFIDKIHETGAIDVDSNVERFAKELWQKVGKIISWFFWSTSI